LSKAEKQLKKIAEKQEIRKVVLEQKLYETANNELRLAVLSARISIRG
jgi:hypothetical protein